MFIGTTVSDRLNLSRHLLGEQARRNPTKPALILVEGEGRAESWTYGELDLSARRLAAGFLRTGLKPGDRVLLRTGNDIAFVTSFFALVGAHWHLPMIGVLPGLQGRGLGSALLHHALAHIDRTRLPAYLESSSERNVPLYLRHGFEVMGIIQVGSSPPIFPMIRQRR
jgi:ribosomal protein S18 acetylase RimI-like enzyme